MEKLLAKVTQLGINIDTDVLAELAKYWVIGEALRLGSMLFLFGGLFIMIFLVVKNFGTGKWKG